MRRVVTEKDILQAPYVRSAVGALRDAVVVGPGAALDRVVPVQGEPSPIVERAKEQHATLVRTLTGNGVRVHPLESADESGYATFVADCALVLERGAILLRPTRIDRRRETPAVERKLAEHGIPILGRIEAPGLLDGGDVALSAGVAYVGVPIKGQRSNTIGRAQLEALLSTAGIRSVELALAPEVPRLRDILSVVADDLIVVADNYVDVAPLAGVARLVAIPRGDQLGAGLLTLAPKRVLANLRFRVALPILRKAKIDVIAIDLWEFGKVGAGPSSLALPLKRA